MPVVSGLPTGSFSNTLCKAEISCWYTERLTISRRSVVQRWPAVPAAEKTTPRATNSKLALGQTMAALLPPSSSNDFLKLVAHDIATWRPMAVEPVALTSLM